MSNQEWRKSREYRIWRAGVVRRDVRCVICDDIKNRHAHHLNNADEHSEQRYDVGNGVTLCRDCHRHYHCEYHSGYDEKTTADDFYEFYYLCMYLKNKIIDNMTNMFYKNMNRQKKKVAKNGLGSNG
jgi:hypothetical protein